MEREGNSGGTKQVLVVDDDDTLLAIVRLSLGKDGLVVETASSGTTGLARLAADPPDLVVLDVVLPDLTGWEFLRRIRQSCDVPVLILSARDSAIDKARGLDLGADDYLTKPFDLLEFEARVRALLRRARPITLSRPQQGSPLGLVAEDLVCGPHS